MLFCCTGPDAVHEGDYYDADTKFCLESVSITPDRKVLSRRFDDIRPSASDSYIVQSTPRFGQAVSSNSPRVCILSYVNQLKGCVKELNIAIYFFFPPITQWCSISDVLITGRRGVSDFSVLKYY